MRMDRVSTRSLIEKNIREHGFHVYLIPGSVAPRFVYTIGLTARGLPELLFCGAAFYSGREAVAVVNSIGRKLLAGGSLEAQERVAGVPGEFCMRTVHGDWLERLMLGATERYEDVRALQLVPGAKFSTVDVPDTSHSSGPTADGIWRWIDDGQWPYQVPKHSTATTNLRVLRGERATEAARWEEDLWEIFSGAGPEVAPADVRMVPLATLLGADATLRRVTALKVGEAIRRAVDSDEWEVWREQPGDDY